MHDILRKNIATQAPFSYRLEHDETAGTQSTFEAGAGLPA
jgi:hypothetical protein